MTGFSPVATLAGKQSTGLFGPSDKLLMQFPPYFKSRHPYKNKKQTTRACFLFLVRMTGFEPTRLSTLEPETSASAVPPHPLIKLKIESGKLKVI